MQKLVLILFLVFGCGLMAVGQLIPQTGTLPVAAGTGVPDANKVLSGNLQKARGSKDSLLSAPDRYIRPGAPVKTRGRDTASAAGKHAPALAPIENDPPEPDILVSSLDHGSCKGVIFIVKPRDSGDFKVGNSPPPPPPAAAPPPHVPFMTVHGNVLYNLNYYSHIDTPYNESNIYQHTIQTWLDVLIKGEYPFRIMLTNHFSNSNLFPNYTDYNLGYNNNGFTQQIKDQLRRQFLQSLTSQKQLDSLQQLMNKDLQKLKGLQTFGKNPALVQKMVEAKEAAAMKKPADSTSRAPAGKADEDLLDSVYASKQRQADSIRGEIARIQQLLQKARQLSQTRTSQALSDIQRLDNPSQLHQQLPALGMSDSSLPKGYKTLMAVKSFNIGRTVVNYSELSAKNISVNGVQAEYNPSMYYAVAAGSVDYRFRDFIVQQPGQPHQYLSIFRVGKGLKDGNSIILTYFTGRRQLYNAATTDSVSSTTQAPSSSLMGFTVEGNYHLTKNILFTGEVAKSSSPSYAGDSTTKATGSGGQLFRMGDHSNEAWSAKANAFFPATQTRVRATYKHLAENFQSFSIFTDGSAQSAWSANVDQPFFRKQLDILLGANTNDFSNPLIGQEYKSTTVFKSIQATLRRKSWPVISLGYFPSSQITRLGNGEYLENLFYTLTGNVTDSYSWHHLLMNTTVLYTQFYNRAADSGFTYFNTRNLMLSQTVFLDKFTLTLNASGAVNQDYQLYTLEGKVQHTIGRNLSVGAGIRYNKQTVYDIDQLGYSAEMALRLKRLGQLQVSADKGFIPGMNNRLVPDNTGRLTYLKTF